MLTRKSHTRPGLTLTEALVALFVAALGFIALLVLFPLGALQMGQALKDERCAQCSMQADGIMRWYHKAYCVDTNLDTYTNATTNPNTGSPSARAGFTAGSTAAFPVVLDPIGYAARSNNNEKYWVGGMGRTGTADTTTLLPARRNLSVVATTGPRAFRLSTLLDDLSYADTGTGLPTTNTSGQIERQGRYNWFAVLQPLARVTGNGGAGAVGSGTSGVPIAMTICVFDGRAAGYAPAGMERVFPRAADTHTLTNFALGGTQFTVGFPANARPPLFKGRWICDASVYKDAANNVVAQSMNFHRVISATDGATANTIDVELQTAPRAPAVPYSTVEQRVIIFSGLAEVFERPPIGG